MQSAQSKPFIATLWNNPIAQINFPKHKDQDFRIVHNANVFSFRMHEVRKYSSAAAVGQDEIQITTECSMVRPSVVEKTMQLLAGFVNVSFENTEMIEALQVMVALGKFSMIVSY